MAGERLGKEEMVEDFIMVDVSVVEGYHLNAYYRLKELLDKDEKVDFGEEKRMNDTYIQ